MWGWDETKEMRRTINPQHNETEHLRGEMNGEGIYITRGNNQKIYIYDINMAQREDREISLIQTFSAPNSVQECFFEKDENTALCCLASGAYVKFNIQNFSLSTVMTGTGQAKFSTCMQTSESSYILLGSLNEMFIFSNGSNKKTYKYDGGYYVHQIAEIRPNILISADDYTSFIHDLTNLTTIPTPITLSSTDTYFAVINLKSKEGDFALGGKRRRNSKGYLDIMHLDGDNQSIKEIKSKNMIPGWGCNINTIREISQGVIVFGGNRYCEHICYWIYETENDPLCWDDRAASSISDFASIPINTNLIR